LAEDIEVLEEVLLPVMLSTTNPTGTDVGMTPGRRDAKLATNCISYGRLIPTTKQNYCTVYRILQEERSIFWEVIVSAILSKKVSYSEKFPRQSCFTVQTSNTPFPHTICRVH
jgi:hypothetical protein